MLAVSLLINYLNQKFTCTNKHPWAATLRGSVVCWFCFYLHVCGVVVVWVSALPCCSSAQANKARHSDGKRAARFSARALIVSLFSGFMFFAGKANHQGWWRCLVLLRLRRFHKPVVLAASLLIVCP